MKRFHVHVHVDDLDKSIGFYSKLFAAEPSRVEGDYAKWMLEDPRLNFAISTRGSKSGIDHLGFHTDPQGIAWEHFHTLGNIPVFSEGQATDAASACCTPTATTVAEPSACCAPAPRGKPIGIAVKSSNSCC